MCYVTDGFIDTEDLIAAISGIETWGLGAVLAGQPLYRMTWHRGTRLLELTWCTGTAEMNNEDLRETLEVLTDSAIHHRAKCLLVAAHNLQHSPSPEILAWTNRVFARRLAKAGTRRLAWVDSGPKENGVCASKTYAERSFTCRDDAVAWLLQQSEEDQ